MEMTYGLHIYIQTWQYYSHLIIEVGRVPGDYPVPAGYCTTRHYPDPAGYYFKMWPDPGICHDFCDSQVLNYM